MLNVGLTGGIACGKTTVAQMFVRHGACLIDLDKLAQAIVAPQLPAWQEIVELFGNNILLVDGSINRNKLAKIVFTDKEKLKKLNNIVHPRVLGEWSKSLGDIEKKNKKAIVISEVPLLFEANLQNMVDLSILVVISPEEQINRLMTRNGLTEEEAKKRLESQLPIEEKIKMADIVIENRGAPAETEKIVAKVWKELLIREENKRKNYFGGK
jgi:dephospho-CoA kinase